MNALQFPQEKHRVNCYESQGQQKLHQELTEHGAYYCVHINDQTRVCKQHECYCKDYNLYSKLATRINLAKSEKIENRKAESKNKRIPSWTSVCAAH